MSSWPGCQVFLTVAPTPLVPLQPSVHHKGAIIVTESMKRLTIEDQWDKMRVLSDEEINGENHQGTKFTAIEQPKEPCVDIIRKLAHNLRVSGIEQSILDVKEFVDKKLNSMLQLDMNSDSAKDSDELRKESAIAIAMCTLRPDLDDHTKSPDDNFFFKLNDALRRQLEVVQRHDGVGRDFMYFLMKGLEDLPPFSNSGAESIVWRGVSAEGAVKVLTNYKPGSMVRWIGMSTATLKPSVAVEYAGQGGLLLRISLQRKKINGAGPQAPLGCCDRGRDSAYAKHLPQGLRGE
mmetsp:Transcript_30984/g.83182  ORF Transcript_30984/g.83182 Transcript_30984/m.83182 type:complete len:292 (-) Transcript_30984:456-1331(-)